MSEMELGGEKIEVVPDAEHITGTGNITKLKLDGCSTFSVKEMLKILRRYNSHHVDALRVNVVKNKYGMPFLVVSIPDDDTGTILAPFIV